MKYVDTYYTRPFHWWIRLFRHVLAFLLLSTCYIIYTSVIITYIFFFTENTQTYIFFTVNTHTNPISSVFFEAAHDTLLAPTIRHGFDSNTDPHSWGSFGAHSSREIKRTELVQTIHRNLSKRSLGHRPSLKAIETLGGGTLFASSAAITHLHQCWGGY